MTDTDDPTHIFHRALENFNRAAWERRLAYEAKYGKRRDVEHLQRVIIRLRVALLVLGKTPAEISSIAMDQDNE